MKLTAFLLLVACIQVSARGYSQSISLHEKNAPMESIFKEIKKQSGYSFVYTQQQLGQAKKVNVDVTNATLETVLQECFKDQPLAYTLVGKTIVISPKKTEAPLLTEGLNPRLDPLPPPPTDVTIIVLNNDGQPLEGASITVKGNNKGVVTDINGRVTFKAVDDAATLVVSFTGYQSQEFKINKRSSIGIRLLPSTSELDEVQIGAYSKTSKRLQTGNVATVKGEDIEKQPVTNALLALQGRVPGLVITQSSGIAGGGITVRIQGTNSLRNGNDPFYVVDGVPYLSQLLPTYIAAGIFNNGNTGPNTSPLNYINPSDIESIEVLKDADATAIYGSRAANGAILITTKKGKEGQAKVDINLQQGIQFTPYINLMNTKEYLAVRKEAFRNDGLIPSADPNASGTNVYAPDLMFWDTTRNTDWQKTLEGRTAQWTNINASVSGGTSNIQYLIGGTYNRQGSMFPGDFADQKGSVHFNLAILSANQKFRVQFSGNYMNDNNKLPNGDLTNAAYTLPPDAPNLYNPDGTLNWALNSLGNSTWTNPLGLSLYSFYQNTTNNVISNVNLSYKILPGLEISTSLGYNNLLANEISYSLRNSIAPASRSSRVLSANYSNNNISTWITEPQVNFKRNIGNGKLEALLGATIQQSTANGLAYSGSGYVSEALLADIRSATSVTITNSTNSVYKYNAAFGRLNYNWLSKYIVNVNIRRDGTSRFGENARFHNFWSVGGAYIFTEEKTVKSTFKFLSFGKLRVSYGTTGSDQIGNYQYMNLYSSIANGIAYQGTGSLTAIGLNNPYLQWEETKKLSLGIDLGFLNDRILINAVYARNRSSNQLGTYILPLIAGFSGVTANLPALIQNTSFELSLNTINIKNKNFNWTTAINFTIPKNKLVAFDNIEKTPYASMPIGLPITGTAPLYHFLGVDPATGLYQFADINGNPTTSSPAPNVLADFNPKFYGGFKNSIQFKNLQLDILFQFIDKKGLYPNQVTALGGTYFGKVLNGNAGTISLPHWQKPGDISSLQRFSTNNSSVFSAASNAANSDANLVDASYIRLTNLSLSYQIPEKYIRKAHLKSSSVYIQGQNLLTITRYPGTDPENQSTLALPPLKVLTVGFKVGL